MSDNTELALLTSALGAMGTLSARSRLALSAAGGDILAPYHDRSPAVARARDPRRFLVAPARCLGA